MRKILLKYGFGGVSGLGVLFLPVLALAQDVEEFGRNILDVVNGTIVPVLFAFAFLFFVYGMAKYFIFSGGKEEDREQGRSLMVWGIIAFFVMVSIWGIIRILSNSADIQEDDIEDLIPKVPDTR